MIIALTSILLGLLTHQSSEYKERINTPQVPTVKAIRETNNVEHSGANLLK